MNELNKKYEEIVKLQHSIQSERRNLKRQKLTMDENLIPYNKEMLNEDIVILNKRNSDLEKNRRQLQLLIKLGDNKYAI